MAGGPELHVERAAVGVESGLGWGRGRRVAEAARWIGQQDQIRAWGKQGRLAAGARSSVTWESHRRFVRHDTRYHRQEDPFARAFGHCGRNAERGMGPTPPHDAITGENIRLMESNVADVTRIARPREVALLDRVMSLAPDGFSTLGPMKLKPSWRLAAYLSVVSGFNDYRAAAWALDHGYPLQSLPLARVLHESWITAVYVLQHHDRGARLLAGNEDNDVTEMIHQISWDQAQVPGELRSGVSSVNSLMLPQSR